MTTPYSQNKVSEAIWPWQKPVSSQQDVPPTLLFSLLTLLVAWAIGSLLYFYGHLTIAILAFSISMFVFIAARFFPKGYVVIERFFKKFSAVVGGSLTWLFGILIVVGETSAPFIYTLF